MILGECNNYNLSRSRRKIEIITRLAEHYRKEPHTNFQSWNAAQVKQAINSMKKRSKGRKSNPKTTKKNLNLR